MLVSILAFIPTIEQDQANVTFKQAVAE